MFLPRGGNKTIEQHTNIQRYTVYRYCNTQHNQISSILLLGKWYSWWQQESVFSTKIRLTRVCQAVLMRNATISRRSSLRTQGRSKSQLSRWMYELGAGVNHLTCQAFSTTSYYHVWFNCNLYSVFPAVTIYPHYINNLLTSALKNIQTLQSSNFT